MIPVIIHLVSFRRRRTVYFSNNALLKEVYKEKARVKRLRELIVLILRMLFIAALVLALNTTPIRQSRLPTLLPSMLIIR